DALKEATGHVGTVSTRFTHVYPDGPAIYYTFGVKGAPGRLIEQWRHIKARASDALIAAGGTITHHHAVGRDHMAWYRMQRPALFGARGGQARARPGGDSQPGGAGPLAVQITLGARSSTSPKRGKPTFTVRPGRGDVRNPSPEQASTESPTERRDGR